jgi:spore germination protein YaaH
MKKNILFLIAGLSVMGIIFAGGFFYYNSFNKSDSKNNLQTPNIITKAKQKENDNQFLIAGWIPDWGSVQGLQSIRQNGDMLDSVSPVWYYLNKDGTLKNKTPSNSQQIIEEARNKNIEILPSIASFDHEELTPVLQNNLDQHVENILAEVNNNNFDGIDIDYESIKLSDQEKFFEFLEKLSAGIKQREKRLTIAVLPKWGEDKYLSLIETRQVQDYARIAPLVDEIRLMTYDYTGGGSEFPGPIAPLNWLKEVIDYADSKADISKFSLGVHLYSYEKWVEVPDVQNNLGFDDPMLQFKTDFTKQGKGKIPSRSYTFDVVGRVLSDYEGITEEYEGEKIFKYSKVNNTTKILENRFLVYVDKQGIQDRIDLAKNKGLKGVTFWRLGGEGELIRS